jgi:hypothetical protein
MEFLRFSHESPNEQTHKSEGDLMRDSVKRKKKKMMNERSNEVSDIRNVYAALTLWLILAGFLVFPTTFPSLARSSTLGNTVPGRVVQHAIQNIPLLIIGSLCMCAGTAGIFYLWYSDPRNYIWLIDKIFL